MNIVWDKERNDWLQVNRLISFEEISGLILDGTYIDIVENPTRDNQMYFIMNIKEYKWVVPFLIDDKERIVLKAAFPIRKFHNKYGGDNE